MRLVDSGQSAVGRAEPGRWCRYVAVVLAVTANGLDFEDPLSGLEVGDRPDPDPPSGWEVVEVRAASLNHHDLWTLRGIGMTEERLPVVLGCDAAGLPADGRRGIDRKSVVE